MVISTRYKQTEVEKVSLLPQVYLMHSTSGIVMISCNLNCWPKKNRTLKAY